MGYKTKCTRTISLDLDLHEKIIEIVTRENIPISAWFQEAAKEKIDKDAQKTQAINDFLVKGENKPESVN